MIGFPWGRLMEDKINRRRETRFLRRRETRFLRIRFRDSNMDGLRALRALIRDGDDVKIGRTNWRPIDGDFRFFPDEHRAEATVNLVRVR